jgi:hypothetical protein
MRHKIDVSLVSEYHPTFRRVIQVIQDDKVIELSLAQAQEVHNFVRELIDFGKKLERPTDANP